MFTLNLFFSNRGRFSVIKRCLDNKTKKPYVAKLIKYDDDTDLEDTLQEFEIQRSIKGDKVVILRDAFLMRRYLVLVMDLYVLQVNQPITGVMQFTCLSRGLHRPSYF